MTKKAKQDKATMLSFSQLTLELQNTVQDTVNGCAQGQNISDFPISRESVFSNRVQLPEALKRSKNWINKQAILGFTYLDENEAAYCKKQLSFAFYLALADWELGLMEERNDLEQRKAHLLYVTKLLDQLRSRAKSNYIPAGDPDSPDRYFGMLKMAPVITNLVQKMTLDSSIKTAVENAADSAGLWNYTRMNLVVFSAMMIRACLALSNLRRYTTFAIADATMLRNTSIWLGPLGASLNFFRLAVNTAFLVRVPEQIKSLNLNKADKSTYWKGKWNEKKFLIFEDVSWGFVNAISFVVLLSGVLGYYGSLLNCAVIALECCLCMWNFKEVEEKHKGVLNAYDDEIKGLQKQIGELESKDDNTEQLQREKNDLSDARKEAVRAREYDLEKLSLNIKYTCSLLLSFALLCCLFSPYAPIVLLPPFAALMAELVGGVMCFGFTMWHTNRSSELRIGEIKKDIGSVEAQYETQLALFKSLNSGENDMKRQAVYLSMQRILSKTEHQEQQVKYQQLDLACNMICSSLMPVLFITIFVFMPVPTTMAAIVFGVCVASMLAAKAYVNRQAPKARQDEVADESALFSIQKPKGYEDFCEQAESANSEQLKLELLSNLGASAQDLPLKSK
ncbi:MAG: hypothetical protein QNK11_09415 [Legionella sp.]|nr:hypothetical protein [Legionella sp.]